VVHVAGNGLSHWTERQRPGVAGERCNSALKPDFGNHDKTAERQESFVSLSMVYILLVLPFLHPLRLC